MKHQFHGHCLLPNELVNVETSCLELRINERFQSVEFFGKIFAQEKDYIIAAARTLNHFEIIKKFFFSEDGGLSFAELPPVEQWMEDQSSILCEPFTGTISHTYTTPKPEGEAEADEDNAVKKDEEPVLSELQRLSYAVNQISKDCFIAPKDYLRLTVDKEFVVDHNYKGMSFEDARDFGSYVHLNQPDLKKIYDADAFSDINEILKPIGEDLPNGWKFRTNGSGYMVLRNLTWEGFEFQTKAHSNNFAQGYFGNGLKREEINFMLV